MTSGPSSIDTTEAQFVAEFETRLEEVVAGAALEGMVRPLLHRATLSFAGLDASGVITWTDDRFGVWVDIAEAQIIANRMIASPTNEKFGLTKSPQGHPVLLTAVKASSVVTWTELDQSVRQHLSQSDGRVLIAVSLSHMSDEVEFAARALGLSNLEARVCAALFMHGNIKRAAIHADVSYHTARKALSGAMKTLGLSRQTSLIRKLSELATVAAPPREAVEQIVIDVFGFERRDAKLIHLLCEGFSRADAAKIAGISQAVAKDRFAYIFQELGISSATDLPPLVMSAFAAAVVVHDAPPLLKEARRDRAPLRLIRDADERVIAVNDYGPEGGVPVLIAHSSLSTRHPFMSFVDALRSQGFRPFTIDRPGFGLTDHAPELPDRFETGVDDVKTVCKALGFETIHVVTRGGAFHSLALARRFPELINRVVVINPDLLQHDCSKRKGRLGLVRHAFDRHPNSVERVARWTSSYLSRKRIETIIRAGVGDAPTDIESFSDRQNLNDYVRSITAFSTGTLSGFIREQRGYVLQTQISGLATAENWVILMGESDPIHDPAEILEFWTAKLPGADVKRVMGAGRFLSLSHPECVIAALTN